MNDELVAFLGLGNEAKWMAEATCHVDMIDPETFFPEPGVAESRVRYLRREVCGPCPVRLDCLNWALERNEPYGIWGGVLPRERREMLRRRLVS